MKLLHGAAAAPGVARGPWVLIGPSPTLPGGRIRPEGAAAEVDRLRVASEAAAAELDAIARRVDDDGHADEAAIFSAQAGIARDRALETTATERITGAGEDAVAAIQAAAETFAGQLRSLDDELLAARAADVLDVGHRIAALLAGEAAAPDVVLDRPSVVVAGDLPPSVTATLPRDRLLGIALEGSSPTAHAAILARAYGIPAVVGVAGLLDEVRQAVAGGGDHELALDGGSGEVSIDPDEATSARFDRAAVAGRLRHESDLRESAEPAITADGVAVTLLANIGAPGESDAAVALGAKGVGLFRTEFLFLERTAAPSEDEQVAAYESVVRDFAPHPVTIRLLDIGGDKPIPYLPIAEEANPMLGVRALRLARVDPALFVTQLRALYRAASVGPLKVMAPMVADGDDVDLLLALADRARTELRAEGLSAGDAAIGVMLEVPSAILTGDAYLGRISFASLGTNDLLQYTLAVDRGNAALERYRDPLHPAVLRLVRMAVEASRRAAIELSVCGEMAGDPDAALALVGLGVRSLSMAASSLPTVRRAVRAARGADLEAAATLALEDASAEAARARFRALRSEGAAT